MSRSLQEKDEIGEHLDSEKMSNCVLDRKTREKDMYRKENLPIHFHFDNVIGGTLKNGGSFENLYQRYSRAPNH